VWGGQLLRQEKDEASRLICFRPDSLNAFIFDLRKMKAFLFFRLVLVLVLVLD
jgi:hypothetical protein